MRQPPISLPRNPIIQIQAIPLFMKTQLRVVTERNEPVDLCYTGGPVWKSAQSILISLLKW